MAIFNDIHSIIVSAETPNFDEHMYTEIYAGVDSTPVINGITVTMAAGSSIKLKIRTISGGEGCFLLGENINVFLGSPNL